MEETQCIWLGEFLKHRIDAGFHRPLSQQLCAKSMYSANKRVIKQPRPLRKEFPYVGIEFASAAVLQLLPPSKLICAPPSLDSINRFGSSGEIHMS